MGAGGGVRPRSAKVLVRLCTSNGFMRGGGSSVRYHLVAKVLVLLSKSNGYVEE